jgi:tripartite-type tricarboxylate transporter receptor subunit TctC
VAALPVVPTRAVAGAPGYVVIQWNGVIAPRGTPKAIIAKLNAAMNKAIAAPDVQKILLATGAEPEGGTPEACGAFIKGDIAKWAKVVRDSHMKVDR